MGQDQDRPDHPDDGRSRLGFYGMSTFEGPMMSIKCGQLAERTTPTGPLVTSTLARLGWNGMITFGALYFLVPRLCGTANGSTADAADQLALLAGHNRHRSLRRVDVGHRYHGRPDVARSRCQWASSSTALPTPSAAKFPMYVVRGLGGVLYLVGALIMVWNMWMTIRGGARATAQVGVPAE